MKDQKRSLVKRLSACAAAAAALGMLTLGVFAAGVSNVTAQLSPQFNILVNGAPQTFYDALGREAHPIVYNGATYLPLRAIGELMGKNVNWDQSTLTVTLAGARTAAKTAGTPDADTRQQQITAQVRPDFTVVLDGTVRTFTDASGAAAYPLLYNGATYLPLRAIGGLMGASVGWDAATSTVTLTTNGGGSLVTDADSFNQNSGTAVPNTPAVQPGTNPGTAQGTMISAETAKAKALAHAGLAANQVTFVQQKLDWEDGRQVYDVEFYTADYREYDYEIDAYTGEVVSYDYDAEYYTPPASGSGSGSYIGEERVRNIVLAKVPGATARNVVKLKLDFDDGRWEYEGEIRYNGWEYEFEVDAYTGTILSWEVDR